MRAVDRKAPRPRYKFNSVITLELIDAFKIKYPQYAGYDAKELMKAIKLHNESLFREVIDYRDGIELPSALGYIFIGSIPPFKKPAVAWSKSEKLGVRVFHTNTETDGRGCKIFYCNYGSKYKFANKNLWYFTPVRQFKTATGGENMRKNWRKYIVVDDFQFISELYEKRTYRDKMRKSTKLELETYNEFEL